MTVETPTAPQQDQPKADAERTHSERFPWSAWVNVGEGAENCPNRENGRCKVEAHFHAWVRLPNPYQVRDITLKARAAKARTVRLLRDEESDKRVILEDELYALHGVPKEILADEIVDKSWNEDYLRAVREVDDLPDPSAVPEDEEAEVPRLYANIDQDREEYERRKALPEEQRGEDFAELERTVGEHSRAIDTELTRIQDERKAPLMERSLEDLIEIVRRDRMEKLATEEYLHTFFTWQTYACTYKPKATGTPTERIWPSIEAMKFNETAEVIETLRNTFERLESAMAGSRLGKGS